MHIVQSQTFGHTVRKRHFRHLSRPVENSDKRHKTRMDADTASRYYAMSTSQQCTQEPLSVFNQCSPRGYICVVLCFPCEDDQREDAVEHLQQSVKGLAIDHPLFAGRLQATSDGKVVIRQSRAYSIPFEVVADEDIDYEQLRRSEFPPASFIRPRFGIPGITEAGDTPVPVAKVDVAFVRGGLLLSIFLQHAVADGGSLRVFLEALGNQTRDISTHIPSDQKLHISSPKLLSLASPKLSDDKSTTFKRLVASCPEYTILPDLSGPTQPRWQKTGTPMAEIETIGKIFVFSNDRVHQLRKHIQELNGSASLPTAYMCLAALTFAHVTKARITKERSRTGFEPSQTAVLWNSVNWRPRAFPGSTGNYFGNAVLPAVTRATREQVNAAAHDDYDLARLVPLVKASIDVVDEEYVSQRMAMMAQAADPRMVGVNYDPRSPEVLCFNTWRYFGADVEWNIPGVPVTKPDTIRRGNNAFGLGHAIILPSRADSCKQELLVSLTVDAMNALCQDERFMTWVDRVIG